MRHSLSRYIHWKWRRGFLIDSPLVYLRSEPRKELRTRLTLIDIVPNWFNHSSQLIVTTKVHHGLPLAPVIGNTQLIHTIDPHNAATTICPFVAAAAAVAIVVVVCRFCQFYGRAQVTFMLLRHLRLLLLAWDRSRFWRVRLLSREAERFRFLAVNNSLQRLQSDASLYDEVF